MEHNPPTMGDFAFERVNQTGKAQDALAVEVATLKEKVALLEYVVELLINHTDLPVTKRS